ncbi:Uncharacterised protein [Mycobacteroides abscessus subsp. massiliense]|nr:Uncharacterised protein [Mycobacteroides abscessus subsp. massiliense]
MPQEFLLSAVRHEPSPSPADIETAHERLAQGTIQGSTAQGPAAQQVMGQPALHHPKHPHTEHHSPA